MNLRNKSLSESVKDGNKLRTFSIIVSGWPAVGKTTVAAELANEFGLEIYNGGDILKQIATNMGYETSGTDWWDSEEAQDFMERRRRDPTCDREVDNKLKEIIKGGNAVITSYTLPWLVKDNCIKLWLQGSPRNRAKRMATRDKISYADATEIVKERDSQNRRIYEDLYGFEFGKDLSVFDFSLNTDMLDLSSLIQISKDIIRKIRYRAA
ncbi:MAG TPA: cytidylate kinase family protein [Nitrososphaeraceae archaeon]|nr:cytidylate kinase family protein [Nitrososphaeraceae archaeon]